MSDFKSNAEVSADSQVSADSPIFLTSAIAYANGVPHIGHIYEIVICDILARWFQISAPNRRVHFLTGTDEYGQKIEKTASALNLTPKELCDLNSSIFKSTYKALKISYDRFIRTTDEDHQETVHEVFEKIYQKGDIYLGNYEGLYNVREERFVTEKEALETNYLDPVTGKAYERVQEESYFFKLETYRQRLIDHITNNPQWLADEVYRREILKKLEEPLSDLSISRTSFSWGVPVPTVAGKEQPTKKHYFYVWFDALTNYLSGNRTGDLKWGPFGPPIHVIGKDIVYFHAIIWPCILFALGIDLPRQIIIHYHINDAQGRKMSKSLGNTVDPQDLLAKYSIDCIRYGLIRFGSGADDVKFSESDVRDRHDSELADKYGNLVARVLAVTQKYCDGKVPPIDPSAIDLSRVTILNKELMVKLAQLFQCGHLSQALELAILEVQRVNQYVTEVEPWSKKYESQSPNVRPSVIRTALEMIYVVTHFLYPFIPVATLQVIRLLNQPLKSLPNLEDINLFTGREIDCSKVILFPKYKSVEESSIAKPIKKPSDETQKLKKTKVVKSKPIEVTKVDLQK
jgi:methionyl-tRNA synthetase